MKGPIAKTIFLFASSLLICSSFLFTPVSAKTNFVNKICNQTELYSYDDCTNALSADPKSKTAKNLKELGRIALNIAIANTTSIQDYIKKKAQEGGSEAFKQCVGLYDLSIGTFRVVIREIDEDPLTASYDARLAADYAVECSADMIAAKVKDAVIAAGNDYIQLFANIAFIITNELS